MARSSWAIGSRPMAIKMAVDLRQNANLEIEDRPWPHRTLALVRSAAHL